MAPTQAAVLIVTATALKLCGQLRITIYTALNLGYDEWHNFLGNRAMVDALLSRLRHFCHTVKVGGPPLREPQG